ncbi:MAG TPA: hypothetical protein VH350_10100 [Candidatus Sulfotelmatobacter sp.]|jgi:hypothetical protein|nr:hypothetical protein [Candidatus Sulfotelmatobacter sp.]
MFGIKAVNARDFNWGNPACTIRGDYYYVVRQIPQRDCGLGQAPDFDSATESAEKLVIYVSGRMPGSDSLAAHNFSDFFEVGSGVTMD